MADNYVKVSGLLIKLRETVVHIEDLAGANNRHWIPLSLIHGGDALRLERANLQTEVTFRLMAWKAEELKL